MNQALVAGHICLDIIPTIKGKLSFEPGRLIEIGAAHLSTGGAVSNTGQALHRLGIQTSLAGKVGDDLFGQAIREILETNGAGLGHGMTVAPGENSSYTIVINLSGEDRMFLHAPGCNDTFTSDDVSDEALSQTRLMHFGYPTLMGKMFHHDGEELVRLFQRAKTLGATTSLDVSLPDLNSPAGRADWHTILKRVLPYTDLFMPSADELLFMLDRPAFGALGGKELPVHEFDRLASLAIDLGTKAVVVKAGERGLFLATSDSLTELGRGEPTNLKEWEGVRRWAPVFEVEVAGTTGAGDATIAGFLMGWLRNFDPEHALQAGVAVGACCCEQPDAVSGVLPWEETQQRIADGWESRSLDGSE